MKSIRNAFLRNSDYHQNLLGEEFDTLVREATDKTLVRSNPEANRKVLIAITDPNTGLELTPQQISQELRKPLRSSNAQRQLLGLSLVNEVLTECRDQLQSVLMEILETIAVLATRTGTNEVNRRVREMAVSILNAHGRIGNQAFRNSSGLQSTAATNAAGPNRTEPHKSIQLIRDYDPIVRQHCEVAHGLINERETRTSGLVNELLTEIKEMRKLVVRAVEVIAFHSSEEVEAAVINAVNVIEAADRLIQFSEEMKNVVPESSEEPDVLDLRSKSSPSLGEVSRPVRRASSDLLGLDDVQIGLAPVAQLDPFQELANASTEEQQNKEQSNFNPFHDQQF
eukprot:g7391.t1